jgi:hypothetical protein
MLRVIARTSLIKNHHTIITKPTVCRALRCNSSTSTDKDYSHKVYALPFKLPEEKVQQIVNIASYVNQHAFFGIFKIIKSVSFVIDRVSTETNTYSSYFINRYSLKKCQMSKNQYHRCKCVKLIYLFGITI